MQQTGTTGMTPNPQTAGRPARHGLDLEIAPQPTDTSCGPACLHAVYRFFGDDVPVDRLIRDIPPVEGGGTIAVTLGIDALNRGYGAVLYTCHLHVFDPTWFYPQQIPDFRERLAQQREIRRGAKLRSAIDAYLEFHDRGGIIRMEDLTGRLFRHHLKRGEPIITGLSSTILYRTARERYATTQADDVHGDPGGHFVLLFGYDSHAREVEVADPYSDNPFAPGSHYYSVSIERLLNAILLGVFSFDGNLLVVRRNPADPDA